MTFTLGIAAVTYNSPVDLEILADVGFVRFRTMPLAMVIPLASLDKGYFPPRPSAYPRKYEALALGVHPSNEIMEEESDSKVASKRGKWRQKDESDPKVASKKASDGILTRASDISIVAAVQIVR
eukprot:CAMPEP_0197177698 /NCGR_PEP_ID=MMETSP1423-20130617/3217_1 /TAXON_ID=476441 /ORGANISM="Pseudo-nitzschia heimii, Strain UNC1101" /LENGTH=124 /DNA_ID=CAMNT_0042627291 /DNA_START=651 /DNA_END=1026 /DNA_ORIENTATION=+